MRVLLVNNFFYPRGGSERVFFEEAKLLKSNGHELSYFSTINQRNLESEFSKFFVSGLEYRIWNALRFIYCYESKVKIQSLLTNKMPDLAHLHNIYQDISPSVLHVLKKRGIPTVVTLHDHKLICPNYTMTRDGHTCEDCFGGRFYKCLLNRCKGGSLFYSMVPCVESYIHRIMKIWKNNVDVFISPSRYLRDKLVHFGWNRSRIEIVPNCLPLKAYNPQFDPGDYFAYLGRLSPEKGLVTLVRAFRDLSPDARLSIIGEGPLEEVLKWETKNDNRVFYTGHLLGEVLGRTLRDALAVVLPSECYENAPMSIIEAMAYGKPVIGARIGGIPEMIDHGINGFLFEPGIIEDLREKLDLMARLPVTRIRAMGVAAREKAEREYGAELHYERLMSVYGSVLQGT